MKVCIEQIGVALPQYDVHKAFLRFAPNLLKEPSHAKIFARLASKCGIEHRWSCVPPVAQGEMLSNQFYVRGTFPSTSHRMKLYEEHALPLANRAASDALRGFDRSKITHLIVTSCTGFYAPGLDLELQRELGLADKLARSLLGFMGCQAAFNALRCAREAVLADKKACVLIVCVELCTLHLQEHSSLEETLGFLQFGDGAAAALVRANAEAGLEIQGFTSQVFPDSKDLIQWNIGDQGFNMWLDPAVPAALGRVLGQAFQTSRLPAGEEPYPKLWAVHPGGRAILDTVEEKLSLSSEALAHSRKVLRDCGNMSSGTILHVLHRILFDPTNFGAGVALGFGPGLSMETMRFHKPKM